MKRFRFRLQRVLDAKESEERQRQRELGQAQKALFTEEKKLSGLNRLLKEHIDQQREGVSKAMSAGDMVIANRWHKQLNSRIRQKEKEVKLCEEEVAKRREILLEVSRDKKVLERLKGKQETEHQRLVNYEQQNMIDDIGAKIRQNRANSEGNAP